MSETKTYRIIIAGSRDFENYEVVKTKAAAVIKAIKEKEPEAKIEIVSGGAREWILLGNDLPGNTDISFGDSRQIGTPTAVQPAQFETGKCWNLPWSENRF